MKKEILYARILKENKKWLRDEYKKTGNSMSRILDTLIAEKKLQTK